MIFERADSFDEERIGQVGHDNTDGRGAATAQFGGQTVAPVAERACRFPDLPLTRNILERTGTLLAIVLSCVKRGFYRGTAEREKTSGSSRS